MFLLYIILYILSISVTAYAISGFFIMFPISVIEAITKKKLSFEQNEKIHNICAVVICVIIAIVVIFEKL